MNQQQRDYLDRYLGTLSVEKRTAHTSFGADYFCADKENANICADLIRRRIKTATCSMKYWYEHDNEPMPEVGHLTVVTDREGNPTSIIETLSVTESRYCDVTEDFAAAEGEGDQTLNWWRKAHWDFFSRECEEVGIEPSDQMMLVLERFEVVFDQEI